MMTDSAIASTPRPRPPAKARRVPSVQFPRFPPPPYAPSLDQVVLDATESTQEQLNIASLDGLPLPFPTPEAEEWINEKSREELSELLLKADEPLQELRIVAELSLTSALCKTLYHDNVTLKNKHETLLSRLPSTPTPTAPTTPIASPALNAPSPLYNDASFSQSLDIGDTPLPIPRFRHSRRISVTPSDLARLADQNAELIDKLEKLEAESQHADHAGKRKLRKLEREIQGLREELEQTQAKEAALEEQVRVAPLTSLEEAQRRKAEREERIRALRDKGGSVSGSDTASDEIRDFAPPSELTRSRSLMIPPSAITYAETSSTLSSPSSHALNMQGDSDHPMYYTRQRLSSTRSQSGAEFVIVSQLLSKIHELEETNAQIKQEQRSTEERLRSAQWDAESIKRAYDYLNGGTGVELEVVTEDDPEESPSKGKRVASGGTIRFSSLRRTIHQDLSRLSDSGEPDEFASGITTDMQSTTRNTGGLKRPQGGSNKARKSVVGLFDSDTRSHDTSGSYPATLRISPSFRGSPAGTESELGDISTWSTAATDGLALPSPALSNMLPTPVEGVEQPFGHTLGSELGSEFGDDWGANAGNHHLRTTSLYEIAGLDLSREASMSPSVAERPLFVFPALDDSDSLVMESTPVKDDLWGTEPGPSTPPRLPGLQLNVEPPTPSPGRLQKPASVRQHQLSQTVRSRTHRWVEGRFSPSPSPSPDPTKRRPGAAVRKRSGLNSSVILAGMDKEPISGSRAGSRGRIPVFSDADHDRGPEDVKDDGIADLDRSVQIRADASGILSPGARREGFTGFVVEVWLWLQFAVVILVFIWAMAKRGPKSVLEEAERRRMQGGGAAGHQ